MTTSRQAQAEGNSWEHDLFATARRWLGGRRALWIVAGIALVAGLALNWSWLVAIGVAPLLVAALPCVAMCALGLCMHKVAGRPCSQESKTAQPDTPTLPEPPGASRPMIAEPLAAMPVAPSRTLVDAAAVPSERGERV